MSLFLCALTALLLAPAVAVPCLHPGGQEFHDVEVGQADQQAIIIHNEGRQELLIRAGYESDEALPSLGWLIPVPAIPSDYRTGDAELFDEMEDFAGLHRPAPQPRGALRGGSKPKPKTLGFEKLPQVSAGPFRIDPLKVSGEEGIRRLREWMVEHDFEPLADSQVEYYTQRDWSFLAIRVEPEEGKDAIDTSAQFPALHLTFDSERIVYPLKFSTHSGVYSVTLYVLTTEEPDPDDFSGAIARGFELAGSREVRYQRHARLPRRNRLVVRNDDVTGDKHPDALRPVLEAAGIWEEDGATPPLSMRVLHAETFNKGIAEAATWDEDLSIPAVDDGERLMGTTSQGEPEPEAPEAPEASGDDSPESGDDDKPEQTQQGAAHPSGRTPEPESATRSGCASGCTSGDSGAPASLFVVLVGGLALASRRRE